MKLHIVMELTVIYISVVCNNNKGTLDILVMIKKVSIAESFKFHDIYLIFFYTRE